MTEDVLDLYGVVLEVAGVTGHRLVEVEFSLVDELQDQRGREGLGDGREVEDGVRGDGDAVFEVGETETLRPEHLLILNNGGGHAGNLEKSAKNIDLLLKTLQSFFVLA